MRIAVIGAGVGGLAAALRLSALGHEVTVLERAPSAGGKCGRLVLDGYRFDTGPSLLTMPWVFRELFADTGSPLEEHVELLRVEPVTRYRFADGSGFDASADLAATTAALEDLSPGAGTDWVRFLGICAGMWRASLPFLTAPAPWPPRRPRPGERAPDPRDLLRVRPWRTLRGLARATVRDPRLRLVVERAATYAGTDPRRAPAALAVAGYVEHAFGAWHVRGGLHALVEAMAGRLEALGGELRLQAPARSIGLAGNRVASVETDGGHVACDAVVAAGDARALYEELVPRAARVDRRARAEARRAAAEPSLSGYALMLGLRGRTSGLSHHTILFPPDYDAEFDDVFEHRRPVRDPTLYVGASCVSDPAEAPPESENWFVLVNAPVHAAGGEAPAAGPATSAGRRATSAGRRAGTDWDAHAEGYERHLLERLAARGFDPGNRIEVRARRTPADLERDTGSVGGAIYGAAPDGRLGSLRRPGNISRVARGLYLVGGTSHPGGGLPLVALSARIVAEEIGAA